MLLGSGLARSLEQVQARASVVHLSPELAQMRVEARVIESMAEMIDSAAQAQALELGLAVVRPQIRARAAAACAEGASAARPGRRDFSD